MTGCHRPNDMAYPVLSDSVRPSDGKDFYLRYNKVVKTNLQEMLMKRRLSPSKKRPDESFMEWPFFLILTLAFIFIYFETVFTTPIIREPVHLILFTVLMLAHTLLHWFSVRFLQWGRVAFYLIVQTVLAFCIVTMGTTIGPLLGVYMGLIGETIGMLRDRPRWMVAAVAIMLGLSFLNYILMAGNTEWYWWLLAMLPLTFFVVVYVSLYTRQVEARLQAQKLLLDLETANQQLTEYADKVEDLSITNERQRMARELHDTLSQGLAGLILQLEAADAYLSGDHVERARAILENSMETARATLSEARKAIDDLRTSEPYGLNPIIRREIEHFTDSTDIPCELNISFSEKIPEQISDTIIRITREALTNIARHAGASHAGVRISKPKDADVLDLEIWDDGAGFDPEKVKAGHYGLLGIRERCRMAGCQLELDSTPGSGTRLKAHFPIVHPEQFSNEVMT
jgi:NarL family two-component system sensor histidine kinase YdfH